MAAAEDAGAVAALRMGPEAFCPPRLRERTVSHIVSTRRLSTSGYELTLERHGLSFQPGMNIVIHGESPVEDREYTIAGGVNDQHLDILYRHIPNGRLTTKLVQLRPNDRLVWSAAADLI